ncbi:hypothetical protein D1007_50193 [Hordeum vulgare]|nr:hypothetical protein D1007_50193 [Hordeum vulgare]
MEGDADEPIDELDKANFSKGKNSGSGNKVEGTCVSTANFHPVILNDERHEQFIEEVETKTPSALVGDFSESAEISHMERIWTFVRIWSSVLPNSEILKWVILREKMKSIYLGWFASLKTYLQILDLPKDL